MASSRAARPRGFERLTERLVLSVANVLLSPWHQSRGQGCLWNVFDRSGSTSPRHPGISPEARGVWATELLWFQGK